MASSSNKRARIAWANREIVYENTIEIESLRGHPLSRFTLDIIRNSGLGPLMTPPARAYPRVVREFYKNMLHSYDEDDELVITITIDNFQANFKVSDIASALGLRGYDDREVNKVEPPNDFDMARELIEDRALPTSLLVPKRSLFHPNMWLFDHIFMRNLCPVGHKQERRTPITKYIHAAYKGYFVDAAELIFTTMIRISTDTRSTPFSLAYPRFITAILAHLGYFPSANEHSVIAFEIFGNASWDLSLQRLKSVTHYVEPGQEEQQGQQQPQRPPPPQGRSAGASSSSGPSFQFTQEHYDGLLAGQRAIFEQQQAMMEQQRVILGQQTDILRDQQSASTDLLLLRQDFQEQQSLMESMVQLHLDRALALRVRDRARAARDRARRHPPPREL